MIINIPTTEELIYKQYLTILNSILVDSKLSPIEIEVLSNLLTVNTMYQHRGEDVANKITFHQETKIRIRTKISEDLKSVFSVQSFNNIMMKLRKKGFITTTEIKHKIPFTKGGVTIIFNLNLKNESTAT
jgi:hypothetical protein